MISIIFSSSYGFSPSTHFQFKATRSTASGITGIIPRDEKRPIKNNPHIIIFLSFAGILKMFSEGPIIPKQIEHTKKLITGINLLGNF